MDVVEPACLISHWLCTAKQKSVFPDIRIWFDSNFNENAEDDTRVMCNADSYLRRGQRWRDGRPGEVGKTVADEVEALGRGGRSGSRCGREERRNVNERRTVRI